MSELNSARENFLRKKKKKALTKINYFRDKCEKKKKEVGVDLEEAGSIWKEVSKKFKWWQSLP